MLEELLAKRKLMKIWDKGSDWQTRRKEILEILLNEEYGIFPPKPVELLYSVIKEEPNFCAGKATLKKVVLTAKLEDGSCFSFPIHTAIPNAEGKYPFFIHINFRDNIPDKYMPTEEIIDNGFAVLSFCHNDITTDNKDFTNGLAGILYKDKKRELTSPGKIAIWSWAARRVLDYAETLSNLDLDRATVVGHSRLGKTALLTGAVDQRFYCSISNDSGCSGAAITRDKQGEKINVIYKVFPFWFCENYGKYMDREHDLPFDQHFLLAAIAPRKVYVASAKEDIWADPESEFLSCVAASEVYEKLGLKGLISPDRLPVAGDKFHEGNIGYHLRSGSHYLSREDWQNFIKFLKRSKPHEQDSCCRKY